MSTGRPYILHPLPDQLTTQPSPWKLVLVGLENQQQTCVKSPLRTEDWIQNKHLRLRGPSAGVEELTMRRTPAPCTRLPAAPEPCIYCADFQRCAPHHAAKRSVTGFCQPEGRYFTPTLGRLLNRLLERLLDRLQW